MRRRWVLTLVAFLFAVAVAAGGLLALDRSSRGPSGDTLLVSAGARLPDDVDPEIGRAHV